MSIRVNVAGTGLQRKYSIKLLQKPREEEGMNALKSILKENGWAAA